MAFFQLKNKFLLVILLIGLTGCTCQQQLSYVPFKTFYSQPPGNPNTWKQPIQLEDIDGSGVFVFTNGNYWYSGPRPMHTKGWIPYPGPYPLPGQVFVQRYILVDSVPNPVIY